MIDPDSSPPPDEILGACPNCDTLILPSELLAVYEPDDDWTRVFAECPHCWAVVHPE